MKLQRLRDALSAADLLLTGSNDGRDAVLSHLTDDSREVREGSLFCAVRGSAADGYDYVEAAVQAGAAAVLAGRETGVAVPSLVVSNDRRATAVVASTWFGNPAERLRVIGVTGTNGKSTTVALLQHLLNENGDVGALGTLGGFDGSGEALYREGLTTPGPIGLHRSFRDLEVNGVSTVVLEASSHALDQDRLTGVPLLAGVFTNLTHDHLDYHPGFEAYRQAKMKLVDLIAPEGFQVVNAGDPAWNDLPLLAGQRRFRFGDVDGVDVQIVSVAVGPRGSEAVVRIEGKDATVRVPHLGVFNLHNAVAALTVGYAMDVPIDDLVHRLATAPQVPGRMERLSDQPLVLRDYAHTPDALERAIAAARPLTEQRLIVLFGCGGDRDRKKRGPMGRIGVRDADLAILTSDNPRTEDPEQILDDMVETIEGRAYLRVTDRREAIRRAINMMDEGDCLMLAGKGHETYQVLGHERVPFDEKTIVQEILTGDRV